MPKVDGLPVHMLYRVVDRRDNFPAATWQSLVRVSQNIASAFNTLHSRGILMADVNETNILITKKGEARLIDCDSFQFKSKNGEYYICNVGIPLWTPPELQGKSFAQVVRTEQHDLFGLAVMLFHILFMGRHPFAGVPKTKDLLENPPPIEACIIGRQFAFSKKSTGYLGVPPNALTLDALPEKVASFFERAFVGTERPTAAEWFHELGSIDFQKCQWGHLHYRRLTACPWCSIWNSGGPNFFVTSITFDTSSSSAVEMEKLLREISNTVSLGFEDLSTEYRRHASFIWKFARHEIPALPERPPSRLPDNIHKTNFSYYFGILGLLGCLVGLAGYPSGALMWFIGGITTLLMISKGKINSDFTAEIKRRVDAYPALEKSYLMKVNEQNASGRRYQEVYAKTVSSLEKQLIEHQVTARNAFDHVRDDLRKKLMLLISDYRALPAKEQNMINERKYNSQLEDFLGKHVISKQKIAHVGPARSAILEQYGIETAWDVKHMKYVPKLGQGEHNLKVWLRRVESRFLYRPEEPVSEKTKQEVRRDVLRTEQELIARFKEIWQTWQSLLRERNPARMNQLQRTKVAEDKKQLDALNLKAEQDHRRFENELSSILEKIPQARADAKVAATL